MLARSTMDDVNLTDEEIERVLMWFANAAGEGFTTMDGDAPLAQRLVDVAAARGRRPIEGGLMAGLAYGGVTVETKGAE